MEAALFVGFYMVVAFVLTKFAEIVMKIQDKLEEKKES